MTKRWLPQWVSEYRDRHGKPRYRFRRKGYAQYLFKHAPGTEGFRQEYEACKHGIGAEPIMPGASRVKPGSFDDLITRYSRSPRSEAHTSELQSLMRISYAVFCLKKK